MQLVFAHTLFQFQSPSYCIVSFYMLLFSVRIANQALHGRRGKQELQTRATHTPVLHVKGSLAKFFSSVCFGLIFCITFRSVIDITFAHKSTVRSHPENVSICFSSCLMLVHCVSSALSEAVNVRIVTLKLTKFSRYRSAVFTVPCASDWSNLLAPYWGVARMIHSEW